MAINYVVVARHHVNDIVGNVTVAKKNKLFRIDRLQVKRRVVVHGRGKWIAIEQKHGTHGRRRHIDVHRRRGVDREIDVDDVVLVDRYVAAREVLIHAVVGAIHYHGLVRLVVRSAELDQREGGLITQINVRTLVDRAGEGRAAQQKIAVQLARLNVDRQRRADRWRGWRSLYLDDLGNSVFATCADERSNQDQGGAAGHIPVSPASGHVGPGTTITKRNIVLGVPVQDYERRPEIEVPLKPCR